MWFMLLLLHFQLLQKSMMAHMQLIFCSAKPSPDHLGDGKVLIANGGREGTNASRRVKPDTIIYTNFFFSFIFSIDTLLGNDSNVCGEINLIIPSRDQTLNSTKKSICFAGLFYLW